MLNEETGAPRPGRRGLLLAGASALLLSAAGCASGGGSSGSASATGPATGPATNPPEPSPTPAATAATATATPTVAALPKPPPWQPNASDVQPDVKRRAVELVTAIGSWPVGGQGPGAAKARVAALGLPPTLVDQAGPLAPAAAEAALEVIEAQYGGILADTSSVMVACRQWTRQPDGSIAEGGTTVDVRLSREQPRWAVTELIPGVPAAPTASPSPAVGQVLAQPRIQLPPAAVADLRSGVVHESVLRAMLDLAGTYRLSLTVLRSGHPLDVFGTSRPSDHPRGRALDVWQIDGQAVVDAATPRRLIESFMRDAAAAGSYNVGGPIALSGGAGNQFFTDETHHDHVHIGFTT
ncbi:hypothetical protein ACGFZP_17585 [Kitasatospora sp. NPDC048239]|uniref:hypothetical protein n=1 Tax=Kitasatospora sp. NPDC048239 TaxID=3364046 RepID=UPI00371649A3